MNLLPPNLAPLAAVCPKDAVRYAINGVSVHFGDNGEYSAAATDTHTLVRIDGRVDAADTYPDLGLTGTAADAMIPAKVFRDILTAAGKQRGLSRKPVLHSTVVAADDKNVTLGYTDLANPHLVTVAQVEGRFPPTADVLAHATKDDPAATVRVKAVDLITALKAMSVVDEFVSLEFRPGKPLVLRSQSDTQKGVALVTQRG